MAGYTRLTNNNLDEYNPEYDFCVGCKYFGEPNGCNRQEGTCSNYDRFMEMYTQLSELEDKIENADRVLIYYNPPFDYRYAVVKYTCQKGQPLKVASYYTYGEELKTGEPLVRWRWLPSTNFAVIEDNLSTEEEAKLRMKELKEARCVK